MSKREKLLKRWRENTPTDEPVDSVESIVDYYFEGSRVRGKRGSHNIIVQDKRLKNRGEFGPLGRLEIPVKHGQKVKGIYLEKLARAVQIIIESEGEGEQDDNEDD